MKAVIAALLLNASTVVSPPPLLPSPELFPEPVELAMPTYTQWWFWTIMGTATVQTLLTAGCIGFAYLLLRTVPQPGSARNL